MSEVATPVTDCHERINNRTLEMTLFLSQQPELLSQLRLSKENEIVKSPVGCNVAHLHSGA